MRMFSLIGFTFVMLACDLDLSLLWLRMLVDLRDGRFLGGNWKPRPPGSALVEASEAVNNFRVQRRIKQLGTKITVVLK